MIIYQKENIGNSYEYRSNCHENWTVPPHIHEYSEIAFTKKGVSTIYLDGEKYLVPENHLIFIRPNQIHEYSDETLSILRCAVFSNDFVPLFYASLGENVLESPVVDFSDSISLLNEFDQTSSNEVLKICGLLNLICSIVLKNSILVPTDKALHRHDMLFKTIEFISNNFKEDIQLKQIAKKIGLHEKYLSSTLHSLTGMNFREFLASYRIDYAKCLLRKDISNQFTIFEIAMQCGFSSINTFNRAFLHQTGLTPSKYKKQFANNLRK